MINICFREVHYKLMCCSCLTYMPDIVFIAYYMFTYISGIDCLVICNLQHIDIDIDIYHILLPLMCNHEFLKFINQKDLGHL